MMLTMVDTLRLSAYMSIIKKRLICPNKTLLDWLALHLEFGSVYIKQLGGISRHHVRQALL